MVQVFASKQHTWFRDVVRLRGTVIPAVVPRALVCGVFGLLVSALYERGWPLALPILAGLIPNIVLGLMLVFRTNTAYERFWEGRKLWGTLVNTSRNLARQIWVGVVEVEEGDRQDKAAALRLLVAFAVATKLHLRQEPGDAELQSLLSKSRYSTLKMMHNPPLEVAFWLGDYLQQQYRRDRINAFQLNLMQELVSTLVDALGGCERILKTPIPLAYAVHLKQLLLIYCLSLPFQLVGDLGWWTSAVVVLISFTLFGVEAIGEEIQNPFGHDPNDLPLDAICQTMLRNVEDLMTLTPDATYQPDAASAARQVEME